MTSALEHTHTGAQIGVNTLQYCQKAPMVRNKFDVYRSVQLQTQFRDFRCGTKNGLLLLLFNKIPVNTFAIVFDRSGAGWLCRFFYTFFFIQLHFAPHNFIRLSVDFCPPSSIVWWAVRIGLAKHRYRTQSHFSHSIICNWLFHRFAQLNHHCILLPLIMCCYHIYIMYVIIITIRA